MNVKDKIQKAYENMLSEEKIELPATLDSIDDYLDMIQQALKSKQPIEDNTYASNIIPRLISQLKSIQKKLK